jgi:acyl carrier protein phosphodiesterase
LVRRAAYLTDADTAFILFEQHYDLLQKCYTDFFKEVKSFAKKQLEN